MIPPPLSWLLRLAAFCHLTMLLAGQHHGVKKCNITCNTMTAEIPVRLLINYQQNQASCGKPAIIFETIKHKFFCADPKEEWVQKAMKSLDLKAAAGIQNGGTFEKHTGGEEPRTAPAARGTDRSAASQPKATGESSSQEAQRALGTSPGLPTGVAGSWRPRPPAASKAPDGPPPAGPERTELYNSAVTTTTSWQSSATYQPGPVLWAEGKASEVTSAQTLPTQLPSTQTPSTQTLPTQTPSTQTLPTQTPSTQTPSTQAPSTQTPTTQAPFTQTLPTQAPSTQAPTISHTATEDYIGPEGQTMWFKGQNPMPENSLGPKEMGPLSAHTDAFMGPSRMPHVSVVPVSSEGAPSRESATSGSWVPKAEEPIHATGNPQRQDVSDSQADTRRQAVGLLAFLGLLFCLGVAMFAYQSLQACHLTGDMMEGLHYVPRNCGSNSYVLVPV